MIDEFLSDLRPGASEASLSPMTQGTPGRITVRILPYGERIQFEGEWITFDAGAVEVAAGMIPVTVDHGGGATERIGRVVRTTSTADGLYAELQLSDTTLGRDVRTLILDGVLTDVSAGVVSDRAREYRGRDGVAHRFGSLDHVAIVAHGAWGQLPAGSKVLAAFDTGGNPPMSDDPTPQPAELTPALPVVEYATRADIDELQKLIATATLPGPAPQVVSRPGGFSSLQEFFLTQRAALGSNPAAITRMDTYRREAEAQAAQLRAGLSEFALANDTTTTAAGLVPDYLSTEIIGLIDEGRPFVESVPTDPIGDSGMSVVYPKVIVKPDVGPQVAEKTQVASQAMDIDPLTVDLTTYAGATDVSLQLIERSQPSFLDRLYAELAGVYASRTDAAAIAAAKAAAVAAGNVSVVADLGADAAATWAAFAAAAADIAAGTKRPATTVWISADRFGQMLTLVDTEGRPLIVPDQNGPTNAQGVGGFDTFTFSYGGFRVIVDPHAAAGTCLVGWPGSVATLELRPQQLRALQVDLLGVNAGVWGLFATVVKYPTGLFSISAA